MTVEEAKSKWCPMSRAIASWMDYGKDGKSKGTTAACSYNRDTQSAVPANTLCLADGCACWHPTFNTKLPPSTDGTCGLSK